MVKIKKILCVTVAFTIALFSLSGCWSSSELTEKAIIMGMAIDLAEDGEKYLVTAQIARPALLSSNASSGEDAFVNVSAEGVGIQAALHEFESKLSREPYTGHMELVIFSEDVAKRELSPVMDYLYRASESRFSMPVIISKGKAADLLNVEVDLEEMPVNRILGTITDRDSDMLMSQNSMGDLLCELVSTNSAITLALFRVEEKSAVLSNVAVIKGDKMVGELSIDQKRYELFASGEYKEGIQVCNLGDGNIVSFRITRSQTSKKLNYENGQFSADIKIYAVARISGITFGGEEYTLEARKELESILQTFIKNGVTDVIQVSKDMEADFIGFGESLYRNFPRQSEELLANWDENYKNFPVTVTVEAKLYDTGSVRERLQ